MKEIELIGAVIIGRNEGERLRKCLLSVVGLLDHVVYADSGSKDASVNLALELGATVVALDTKTPFTAARGRNAGFAHLMAIAPNTEFVQFIDGDCELMAGWPEAAIEFLQGHAHHAVVCGRLRERHPESSIYNRLCDLEWNGPVGDIEACGGIFMIRAKAFAEVGGMNISIAAGEEPEMCLRLRRKGWLIARMDREMAEHDADLIQFRQWWKRAVRSGQGAIDVYARTDGQVFAEQVKRTRLWTIGWALALLCIWGLEPMLDWTTFMLAFLAVVALYPFQLLRIAARMRGKGLSFREALVYGGLMMIGKWAELVGHFHHRYLLRGNRKAMQSGRCALLNDKTLSDWQLDKKRYPKRPWLKEQSIWAIAVYRFGRWGDARRSSVQRWLCDRIYWLLFRIVETLTGISFTKAVVIGPGLRIWHFGNIFIHPDVRIGADCTLRHGVTIGNRVEGGPVPVIGNRVDFGAYAQILGGVVVGDNAKIGAMSVVLSDVPPGATAVGVPANIILLK